MNPMNVNDMYREGSNIPTYHDTIMSIGCNYHWTSTIVAVISGKRCSAKTCVGRSTTAATMAHCCNGMNALILRDNRPTIGRKDVSRNKLLTRIVEFTRLECSNTVVCKGGLTSLPPMIQINHYQVTDLLCNLRLLSAITALYFMPHSCNLLGVYWAEPRFPTFLLPLSVD